MLQSQFSPLPRQALGAEIVELKAQRQLSWGQLAADTGLSTTFVTAALLGQHPLPAAAAEMIGARLGLAPAAVALLQTIPMRGSPAAGAPADPTMYRFYEMIQVYGGTLKALVHEQFGDGIISAIDFKVELKKVEDADGSYRAVVVLDGKFLPYKPF
ncbi:cyanase [Janthinobacterium fluminis]|uniref:Cyanate hydratase n=1 Tax=Janthinobacterium fluminis TaxID=2987524 RepID=A0ABT5K350_9BURK|nr:cyanase [Janthinobacterium fluminis]MDC8758172.1 cyanase [Janthinobacterium fluminis]